jgi:hypothetical protein
VAYKEVPIPAGSSNVERVEWDSETMNLRVFFIRGNVPYVYEQVPKNVAEGFETSGQSAGTYLNNAIKGQYVFSKG